MQNQSLPPPPQDDDVYARPRPPLMPTVAAGGSLGRSLPPSLLPPCTSRLQDLSIEVSTAPHNHSDATPLPPVSEPEREAEQAPSELRSSPLKRKNKRASVSPTAKRKSSLSDVVLVEGQLVVAEAHGPREGDAVVLHTLGSVSYYCC